MSRKLVTIIISVSGFFGLYLFSESFSSHIGHDPVRYDEVVGF